MNDEFKTISRGGRTTGLLVKPQNPYSDVGCSGDQPGDEFKKGCAFSLAILICIPLLTCFAFLALVMTLAKVIPELTEWVLR